MAIVIFCGIETAARDQLTSTLSEHLVWQLTKSSFLRPLFDALVKNACMLQIHTLPYGCSLIARVSTLHLWRRSFT